MFDREQVNTPLRQLANKEVCWFWSLFTCNIFLARLKINQYDLCFKVAEEIMQRTGLKNLSKKYKSFLGDKNIWGGGIDKLG